MSKLKRRFVRSFYRTTWKGVVLSKHKILYGRYINQYLMEILVLYYKGKRVTQPKVLWLHDRWVVRIRPFDIKWVDKSWFKWN